MELLNFFKIKKKKKKKDVWYASVQINLQRRLESNKIALLFVVFSHNFAADYLFHLIFALHI